MEQKGLYQADMTYRLSDCNSPFFLLLKKLYSILLKRLASQHLSAFAKVNDVGKGLNNTH